MSEQINNGISPADSAAEQSAYQAPEAFGEDRNAYAYPSARGMSGYGVASILCALCSFFCMLTVFAGIGLGIAGVARRRSDILSWVGIVLSVAFLIYNIVTLVQVCSNPAAMDFLQQISQ